MNKWISTNDKLPDDGVKVLCATKTIKGTYNIVLGYYAEDMGRWVSGMNPNVTHWMSLPDPPKEVSEI